jgi:hypothetical protein
MVDVIRCFVPLSPWLLSTYRSPEYPLSSLSPFSPFRLQKMMGWWKPYFFVDPSGVQLLFGWATIDGFLSVSFLAATATVAVLALTDRWLAAHLSSASMSWSDVTLSARTVYVSTALWTAQRVTSGLIMLIMMSFNAVLFAEALLFLGAAELWVRLRNRARILGGDDGVVVGSNNKGRFEQVGQIEMAGC